MVGFVKLAARKDPAFVGKSRANAYGYIVDLLFCTTAIGVLILALQVQLLEQRSSYPQYLILAMIRGTLELSYFDPEPCSPTHDPQSSLSLPMVASKSPRSIRISLLIALE